MQRDPQELRILSGRCRDRAKSSTDREATEQLRRWADELADAADRIEGNAGEPNAAAPFRMSW